MALTEEQKAFIKNIVHEAYDERMRAMEQKVFNGFGTSLRWLKWLMGGIYLGLISLFFYKVRS